MKRGSRLRIPGGAGTPESSSSSRPPRSPLRRSGGASTPIRRAWRRSRPHLPGRHRRRNRVADITKTGRLGGCACSAVTRCVLEGVTRDSTRAVTMVVTRPVIVVVTRDRPCAVTMVVTRDITVTATISVTRDSNLRGQAAIGAERPITRGVPVDLVIAVVPLAEQPDAHELLHALEHLPGVGPAKPRRLHDSALFLRVRVREAAQPRAAGDLDVLRLLEPEVVGVVAVDPNSSSTRSSGRLSCCVARSSHAPARSTFSHAPPRTPDPRVSMPCLPTDACTWSKAPRCPP